MPIHFACSSCGKALFAQDQFAGRPIRCPGCQASTSIPQPAGAIPAESPKPEPAQPPTDVSPVQPSIESVAGAAAAEIRSAIEVTEAPAAASPPEPTRRCPICAETIKAAAKKCRFCNAILDETMRRDDEEARRKDFTAAALATAEKSVAVWRAVSTVMVGFSIGWIVWITASLWSLQQPHILMLFNPLLAVGLFWSSRQMRHGPHNLFLSSALTIAMLMPLNILLGMPMLGPEMQAEVMNKNPEMFKNLSDVEKENAWNVLRGSTILFFVITGFLFSLPLWITTVKVASLARLKAALGARQ